MNQEYFKENEANDLQLMSKLVEKLKLNEFGATEEKSTYDCSAFTEDGRYVEIELKRRNFNLLENNTISGCTLKGSYTADTIFIESVKYADMVLDAITNNVIPLYINFFNNGYCAIWNLMRLTKRNETRKIKFFNKGQECIEFANRIPLSLSDAKIYKFE